MDWETILKAYPNDTDAILGIKSLREIVERIMADVTIPVLETPCREMSDFSPFLQVFTPICMAVWKEVAQADPGFDMAEVLKSFIADSPVPEIPEAERDLAEGVMNATVSRFLHLLREKNQSLVPEEWSKGVCPFCGAYPKIGFDAEDKRTLACLSCGHTWRFPRVTCYMCGTSDHNLLGYFDTEEIEGVRVYFCRSCNHYIKIVDSRVRITRDPETEDALTLVMDSLALQEGFVQPE
ncbi:MAG TPA: formate dehydrogenase accessory protein FdhE [Deltaproteobacteria bacterium]|jgi:RNase P subunit RPR2|nr:formate dehydrogenase accessory protein FdhE [Deltaproteobacteria bacterium]HOI07689.1 formate dehydrogenase accessory protein FdhE [Deltaproteobacteria bacterium]